MATHDQLLGRTALYRHYADGVLLYVGITQDPKARWSGHARSIWRHLVTDSTIDWYPSRPVAEAHERQAIIHEQPLFNQQHNGHRGLIWARIMGHKSPTWSTRRMLDLALVVNLEPRLLDLAHQVCRLGTKVCADCVWDELRVELRKMVGFTAADAPHDYLREAWAYELAHSAFYELLPWTLCDEHMVDTFSEEVLA